MTNKLRPGSNLLLTYLDISILLSRQIGSNQEGPNNLSTSPCKTRAENWLYLKIELQVSADGN